MNVTDEYKNDVLSHQYTKIKTPHLCVVDENGNDLEIIGIDYEDGELSITVNLEEEE